MKQGSCGVRFCFKVTGQTGEVPGNDQQTRRVFWASETCQGNAYTVRNEAESMSFRQ